MKKSLLVNLLVVFISGTSFVANAQGIAYNQKIIAPVSPYHETEKAVVSEVNVNINAVRDFRRTFKNATDVKWVQTEKGASVYFTNDGVKMRSSYNAKGVNEYLLKYYDESKMDSELRRRVRSNYYDHNIVIVTEVTRNGQTFFLVKMENENDYLTIRVGDEDMTVFEKTDKAK